MLLFLLDALSVFFVKFHGFFGFNVYMFCFSLMFHVCHRVTNKRFVLLFYSLNFPYLYIIDFILCFMDCIYVVFVCLREGT